MKIHKCYICNNAECKGIINKGKIVCGKCFDLMWDKFFETEDDEYESERGREYLQEIQEGIDKFK